MYKSRYFIISSFYHLNKEFKFQHFILTNAVISISIYSQIKYSGFSENIKSELIIIVDPIDEHEQGLLFLLNCTVMQLWCTAAIA